MKRVLLSALTMIVASGMPAQATRADPALQPPTTPPAQRSCTLVKDENGVWWFESPDGNRIYSIGMNDVSPEPYHPRAGTTYYAPVAGEFHGDTRGWAKSVSALLEQNGFNTLGSWCSAAIPIGPAMYSTPNLSVVEWEPTRCLSPLRPDFEEYVRANVKSAATALPDRARLLGVFLDNEMPWYGKSGWDDIPTYTLLEKAFELPANDPRHAGAVAFLKTRHATPDLLSAAYLRPVKSWNDVTTEYLRGCTSPEAMADREAFTAMLAERFYETTTRIVRAEIPGVLILGTRIPGNAPDAVIRSCGKYCDVVSVNMYDAVPKANVNALTRFWVLGGGKPLMHTEFAWRARQNSSGDPNTQGAGTVVETQAERGAAYASLVSDMATIPYVIGSHWFEFADESPQGRFDGENSNYGIVDIHNKPYTDLLSAMKATNARVHDLHAHTTRKMPAELPKPKVVTYNPGQHPERPPTLDLLGDWTHEPEIWGAPDAKLSWQRRGHDLVLVYNAGSQYGAGVNIFGPRASALAKGPAFATDLDGYSTIVLEATAPEGLQINVVLAEAGAGPSSSTTFDTSAGDDGEGFVSAIVQGTGSAETYHIPIGRLEKQKFFGNQAGAGRIDMQAIRNLGIQVSGEPRSGDVVVRGFRLEK